jgi:hypothetical protein
LPIMDGLLRPINSPYTGCLIAWTIVATYTLQRYRSYALWDRN